MNVEKKMLLIPGHRNGYNPEQCGSTLTIREMIEHLEEIAQDYGDDVELFLVNDGGYTYGSFEEGELAALVTSRWGHRVISLNDYGYDWEDLEDAELEDEEM